MIDTMNVVVIGVVIIIVVLLLRQFTGGAAAPAPAVMPVVKPGPPVPPGLFGGFKLPWKTAEPAASQCKPCPVCECEACPKSTQPAQSAITAQSAAKASSAVGGGIKKATNAFVSLF